MVFWSLKIYFRFLEVSSFCMKIFYSLFVCWIVFRLFVFWMKVVFLFFLDYWFNNWMKWWMMIYCLLYWSGFICCYIFYMGFGVGLFCVCYIIWKICCLVEKILIVRKIILVCFSWIFFVVGVFWLCMVFKMVVWWKVIMRGIFFFL